MPFNTDTRPPLKVFISSTYEDLKAYVHAAEEMLREQKFKFDQFKYWEATGRPSVSECRERVGACDALVVIIGRTYGWIPPVDEGGDGQSSITKREVQWALEKPMPVLPFFIEKPESPLSGSIPDTREERLLADFVAQLRKKLMKIVSSPEAFRLALRHSLQQLTLKYPLTTYNLPSQVGEMTQRRYQHFLDHKKVGNVSKPL